MLFRIIATPNAPTTTTTTSPSPTTQTPTATTTTTSNPQSITTINTPPPTTTTQPTTTIIPTTTTTIWPTTTVPLQVDATLLNRKDNEVNSCSSGGIGAVILDKGNEDNNKIFYLECRTFQNLGVTATESEVNVGTAEECPGWFGNAYTV